MSDKDILKYIELIEERAIDIGGLKQERLDIQTELYMHSKKLDNKLKKRIKIINKLIFENRKFINKLKNEIEKYL